uniref:Uncharacterized protein n=1 Tax=Panagrolaimus superbus TaxID=310955 RepID=A0A914YFI3_9BILA
MPVKVENRVSKLKPKQLSSENVEPQAKVEQVVKNSENEDESGEPRRSERIPAVVLAQQQITKISNHINQCEKLHPKLFKITKEFDGKTGMAYGLGVETKYCFKNIYTPFLTL